MANPRQTRLSLIQPYPAKSPDRSAVEQIAGLVRFSGPEAEPRPSGHKVLNINQVFRTLVPPTMVYPNENVSVVLIPHFYD